MADILGTDRSITWPTPRLVAIKQVSQGLEERKSALIIERSEFLDEWKDISDHFQTRRGRYLIDENRRKRRGKKILNEKGIFASRTCGAGMLAGVSSPSRPWLKLGTPDKDLNEFSSVKRWLDTVEKRLYQVFGNSNYYHAKQSSYRDMGDFGQGPVLIDEDYDNAIHCYCSPPGEYILGVNDRGELDTMFRDMQWTTKDVVQRFMKYGRIPREIQQSWDRGNYETKWAVTAVVQPNIKMIKGWRGPLGMPYMVVYYAPGCSGEDDNNVLAVSGNWENAISAPRWDVQPGDIYGDGPGSIALPVIKSLQELEKRKGQIIDKMAVPPMQAPAAMDKKVISHKPGDVSFYPASAQAQGAGGPISPLYKVDGNGLNALAAETQILEQRVDVAYFVDLFLATINSDRRQVTAREINEVHEEKLIALGPVLERSHYEGLNVDVKRAFGILARNKVLPPPPKEMDGMGLKIEYISLLAVAQRAIGATGIERFAGFLGNLSAGNPEVLDKWDMDQTVDEYGDITGVPASIVRSDEEVQKLRDARAAQTQNANALATAQQSAQTAQTLSQADTGRNSNLLADIIGNAGRVV